MNRYLRRSILFIGLILLMEGCTRPGEEALRLAFQKPPLEFRMNLNHHDFPLDDAGHEQMMQEHLNMGYGGFTINDSEETITTGITFRSKGKFEEWDPATGEVRTVTNNPEVELLRYHGKIYRSR